MHEFLCLYRAGWGGGGGGGYSPKSQLKCLFFFVLFGDRLTCFLVIAATTISTRIKKNDTSELVHTNPNANKPYLFFFLVKLLRAVHHLFASSASAALS
jgi:hypothetical protein